jgi:transposase-like protein
MSTSIIVDELLQQIEVTLPELVYCSKLSVGQKEFSVTMQKGLKAEMTIIMNHDEYDGEKVLEYNRKKYSIYRTFVRDDGNIELYCEVRVGGN